MATLYLACALCGSKQADGLLSRGRWGHLETPSGAQQACPRCKSDYPDWTSRLLSSVVAPDSDAIGDALAEGRE